MKTTINKTALSLLLVFVSLFGLGQPDWSMNPNQYAFSMTVTAQVSVDGRLSTDEGDILGAFVNGACRGIAKIKYEKVLNAHFAFLMIYGDDPNEQIDFRFYDASEDTVLHAQKGIEFDINSIIGSLGEPHLFVLETAQYKAELLSFTIPDQVGTSLITPDRVYVKMPYGTDLRSVVPEFTLSEEAEAYLDEVKLESGVSTMDVSQQVSLKVKSPNPSIIRSYKILVSYQVEGLSEVNLDGSSVMENKDSVLVGMVSADGGGISSGYNFYLDPGNHDNALFYMRGDGLYLKDRLDYEKVKELLVRIKAENDAGGSKFEEFYIHVENENETPTNLSLSRYEVSEKASVNSHVAFISVTDEDEGDEHAYYIVSTNGSEEVFTLSGNEIRLNQSLNRSAQASYSLVFEVKDLGGNTYQKTIQIQVVNSNLAPAITSEPVNYAIEDQLFVYALSYEDPEGDPVGISFDDLPQWLSYNQNTKLLTGTPFNSHVGDVSFTVIADDGNRTGEQEVYLSVLNVNDGPMIKTLIEGQQFLTGHDNSYLVPNDAIVDPDEGDVLNWMMTTENNSVLPEWLSFDPETLELKGNPAAEDQGVYKLKLVATDPGLLKEWIVFTLEVSIPTAASLQMNSDVFKIYPNPASDYLIVQNPYTGNFEYEICSMVGKVVDKGNLDQLKEGRINLQALDPGYYLFRISDEGSQKSWKFLKQ